jgi:hypothetical protein
MNTLKRMLMAVVMLCIIAVGAFAQEQKGGQKPRENEQGARVKGEEKKTPPPDNRGQGNRGGDQKKEKP